jgi:hypothetical protein
MANIKIEIQNCKECPYIKTERIYTSDSWEQPFDWFCTKHNNEKIASYVEWNDEKDIIIPQWCPILIN